MASKNETIEDIVREMRSFELDDPRLDIYSLVAIRDLARGWANRIEAAWKREREAGAEAAQICGEIGEMIGMEAACKGKVADCDHLGNVSAMRDALLRILGTADHLQTRFAISKLASEEILELKQIAESAISAPPRNCDRSECATTKAAQDVWRKEDGGKTAYYEWLLATSTKGETK